MSTEFVTAWIHRFAGIMLLAFGVKVDMAEQAPGVESGAFDVGTICMSCWAPALDKIAHRFKIFNFSDIFHGHALVAGQLDTDMKSVQEFMAEGMEFDEALTATMQQLKGKRMAQAPGDPQNIALTEIAFRRGGIEKDDLASYDVIDPLKLTEQALAGRYDVVVPVGGPIVVELMKKGLKALVRSVDVAAHPEPGREVEGLWMAGPDGNHSTTEWVEDNWETALRFSGVVWRICDFMNYNMDEALEIHMPILNELAGTSAEMEDGRILYSTIQHFIPFDDQYPTYFDPESPFNLQRFHDAYVLQHRESGVLSTTKTYTLDSYVNAGPVYADAVERKTRAEADLKTAGEAIDGGKTAGKDMGVAEDMVAQSNFHADLHNYVDAQRFAEAAAEWAKYQALA